MSSIIGEGATRKLTIEDLNPGVVIRYLTSQGFVPPFCDCLVEKVIPPRAEYKETIYQLCLARPYQNGIEKFNSYLDPKNLDIYPFVLVLNGYGEPYRV